MKPFAKFKNWVSQYIPDDVLPQDRIYYSVATVLYLFLPLSFTIASIAYFFGKYNEGAKLFILGLFTFLYPLAFRLKFFGAARASVVTLGCISSYYYPILTDTFSNEIFYRVSYQNILFLLLTFWVLHPKRDRFWFWLSVSFQFPLVTFGPLFAEAVRPGSLPSEIQQHLYNFTLIPSCMYLFFLFAGQVSIKQRDLFVRQLEKNNEQLLSLVEQSQKMTQELKKKAARSDKKINNYLYFHSHLLRAPIANIKGLFSILEARYKIGGIEIDDRYMTHFSQSIQNLDEQMIKTSEELEKNPPSDSYSI